MDEDSQAWWGALGWPGEGLPLPTAHSPAWRAIRSNLRAALISAGAPPRVRSPRTLGLLLRGTPPGPGETWGSLLAGGGWSELCRALRTGNSAAGLRLASWNLRWMVSPHTAQNAAKRDAIRQWLEAGRTVPTGPPRTKPSGARASRRHNSLPPRPSWWPSGWSGHSSSPRRRRHLALNSRSRVRLGGPGRDRGPRGALPLSIRAPGRP